MSHRHALQRLLAAAIETGEIVRIAYHGGSRPGAIRDVRPLTVTSEELRARDIAAGLDKTFLLAKIDLTEEPVTGTGGGPQSIEEAIGPRIPELQALGWRVAVTPPNMVTVRAYLKNGKPGTAHVSLWFEEYTGIGVVDLDADGNLVDRVERWKSRAPYHVSSASLATRSFATLWKASALFFEEVRKASARPAGPTRS